MTPNGESNSYCLNCGNKVDTQDRFCSSCGKPLPSEEKQFLIFGPWGISVCFGRPGFFVVTQQNNTTITLTNRQIYGLTLKGKSRFVVPYNAITYREKTNYALFRVLYLQYRDEGKIKEVAIMGNPVNYENIQRAYELVHV